MRTRQIAAQLLTACLPLSACGGDDKTAGAASDPKVNCDQKNLSQADWLANCQGTAPATDKVAQTPHNLKLGTPAETAGAPHPVDGPGGEALQITPTTVVYVTAGTGETSANGVFAVVAHKAKSTKAVAASESAPIDGGGWTWLAPDGQAVDTGSGNAVNVTPDGFLGGGAIQPGSYDWESKVFDLTAAQRGGTLVYVDGDGTAFRWAMPAQDAGPEVVKLKKALAQ
jgi:hypothetical protein